MKRINCTLEAHGQAILDILNEAIVHSTALYDYQPRTLAQMADWFAAKEAGRFPVIGLIDEHGTLMGFASYGSFRAWPAYKYSVEHSVYVHEHHRGKGLGRQLMQAVIDDATRQDLHMLVGVIDHHNEASKRLHASLGFVHAGTLLEAGFKFGRWLDVDLYQLILSTPLKPVDG